MSLLIQRNLCPYSAKKLSDYKTNYEHIIPRSIGAPEKLTVQAIETENSRLNKIIDEPFSKDELIKFLCAILGIKGRRRHKELILKSDPSPEIMNGKVFKAKLLYKDNNLNLDLAIEKKFTKNENGEITSITCFEDESEELLLSLNAKKQEKKPEKNQFYRITKKIIHDSPMIPFNITGDMKIIYKQLFKIMYLIYVDTFGDYAIQSDLGVELRRIFSNEDAIFNIDYHKYKFFNNPQVIDMKIVESKENEHAACCIYTFNTIIIYVTIFNIFSVMYVSDNFSLEAISEQNFLGYGRVMRINAQRGVLTEDRLLKNICEVEKYLERLNFGPNITPSV